jgi:hypothetical protein
MAQNLKQPQWLILPDPSRRKYLATPKLVGTPGKAGQLFIKGCIMAPSQLPVMPMLHFACRLFAALSVPLALGTHAYALETPRLSALPGYPSSNSMRDIETLFDVHTELGFISADELSFEKISANHGKDYDVYAADTAGMQRYPEVDINGKLTQCQGSANSIESNHLVAAPGKFIHGKHLQDSQCRAMLGDRITSADLQEGFLAS